MSTTTSATCDFTPQFVRFLETSDAMVAHRFSGYTWAIRSAGAMAGVVGLYRVAGGSADLGFWMVPAFRVRGLLTEACAGVLDFAFTPPPEGLGLARVGWNAYTGNIGSARVARKLGFRFEGTARLGAALRGELRDDWAAGLLATDDRSIQEWPILD